MFRREFLNFITGLPFANWLAPKHHECNPNNLPVLTFDKDGFADQDFVLSFRKHNHPPSKVLVWVNKDDAIAHSHGYFWGEVTLHLHGKKRNRIRLGQLRQTKNSYFVQLHQKDVNRKVRLKVKEHTI